MTAAARDGEEICGRDGRMLAARVEQKNGARKKEKNATAVLDNESPIQVRVTGIEIRRAPL